MLLSHTHSLVSRMPADLHDQAAWEAFSRSLSAGDRSRLIGEAIARQMGLPDDHLPGYMNRFWLVSPDDVSAGVHQSALRVHNILRKDHDRHPHDHPWDFRAIILQGSYVEELLLPDGSLRRQTLRVGDTYTRVAGQYHRIAEIAADTSLWTLCVLGPLNPQGWGFLVDGTHVDSHAYLNY